MQLKHASDHSLLVQRRYASNLTIIVKMQYLFSTTVCHTTNTLIRDFIVRFVNALEACEFFRAFLVGIFFPCNQTVFVSFWLHTLNLKLVQDWYFLEEIMRYELELCTLQTTRSWISWLYWKPTWWFSESLMLVILSFSLPCPSIPCRQSGIIKWKLSIWPESTWVKIRRKQILCYYLPELIH